VSGVRTERVNASGEELSGLHARIARLEAEIAQLRSQQKLSPTELLPPPSYILQSITDAFVAVNREFRYIWANPEAERLLARSGSELLGQSLWELFPELVGTDKEKLLLQAVASRTPLEFEAHDALRDRWYFNKLYPTPEGGLAIFWRDITTQKKAQASIRRQAQVLGQVHDAIITIDLDGNITDWNHGAEQIFGYNAAEAAGQTVSLLYFEEDRALVAPAMLEPLRRDGQQEAELRLRRKSGDACYIRFSLSLLHDQDERPYGILGVATDITGQWRAERALREREAIYHSLVDALPLVACITSPLGRLLLVNKRWEEYAGVSVGRPYHFNWLAWVHPEDALELTTRWKECVRTGQPLDTRCRVRRADGEYRWQLARAVAVRGGRGKIARWVSTLTDIHELTMAREEVRRSEERFRLAFSAIHGIVYDWNMRTGSVHRTGDLEEIVGLQPDEAEGSAVWWLGRIHPEDREALDLLWSKLADRDNGGNNAGNSDSFEAEYRVWHESGRWVHVSDRSSILRDANGIPERVVGSSYNITKSKELQGTLAENNKQLSFQANILATTNDAVIAYDANQRISYFNAASERVYEISCTEALGRPLSEIFTHSWLDGDDAESAASDLAERGSWRGELIHTRWDGTQIFVSATTNVLPPESGGGTVTIIRDISARKRAEIEARERTEQLARATEDLMHFALAVGHDLQAPLRTINLFSQTMVQRQRSGQEEEVGDFAIRIADASARMTTMVHHLLALASVAGSQIEFSDAVSLEQCAETAMANLSSEIEESKATIFRGALPVVTGDAGQMTQLFQNLIGNSIKYRKQGRPLEIHLEAQKLGAKKLEARKPGAQKNESGWRITVRDNGIGFDPAKSAKIFGVFQRLHGTEIPGTGIGLAICKRIVERRGGQIEATGKPGEGAAFSFSIPEATAGSGVTWPSGQNSEASGSARDHTDVNHTDVNHTDVNHTDVNQADANQTGTNHADASQAEASQADINQAQSRLAEFRDTLDLAPVAIRQFDGSILVWTQGEERLFGWSAQEAVGQRIHDLLKTEFPEPLETIDAELLRTGEWTGELYAVKRDGTRVQLASHWALYRDPDGQRQSVIEVHTQISQEISQRREADRPFARSVPA
jgi:PAS domain S-box-containing protein